MRRLIPFAIGLAIGACDLAPEPPPPASPQDASTDPATKYCVDRCYQWYANKYAAQPPAGWCKGECANSPGMKFSNPGCRTAIDCL